MTQAEVAEALDLPQGLISNYEKGARRLHSDLQRKGDAADAANSVRHG